MRRYDRIESTLRGCGGSKNRIALSRSVHAIRWYESIGLIPGV